MTVTPPVSYARHGQVVLLSIENPPVNALSQPVRAALLEALNRAEADIGVQAVVLCGRGRAFIAGADIKEFGARPTAPLLSNVCDRLEASPLLIVASVHGVCLGGGLEVALAAHYRIAQSGARIGAPEVTLGLIPGAGGTQRLPRLTGTQAAVDIIASGRQLSAAEARDLGIIDDILSGAPSTVGLQYAEALLARGAARRPSSEQPRPASIDWEAARLNVAGKARGRIAPVYALDSIRASAEKSFEDGMKQERRLFDELMQSDQRRAMIHAFFAERQASSMPELAGVLPRKTEHLGIVGGGTMGAGIATAALLSGMCVALVENSAAAANTARDRIAQNLEEAVRRGKLTSAGYEKALADKLILSAQYEDLSQSDIVIEAVFEDMAVKKAVFSSLDAVCKPDALLATNTSYLDVTEMAKVIRRPQNFIGLHFFSPAHVMKLLEVVIPPGASPESIATGFSFAKRLGKTAVPSGVGDGFIGNRTMMACRNAVEHMVLDGASPAQIDGALTAFGFAMGPYAVSDLAGLDIGWANRKRLAPRRDPRERVAYFPDRLCELGQFGRKSGAGYYMYSNDAPSGTPNPKVLQLIEAEREERAIVAQDFTPDQIVSRYMAAMVNEAAKVIEAGVARRPRDIDVVLFAGYGFPRHRGGPCKWADLKGLGALLSEIEGYSEGDAYFWRPAPLLVRLVENGQNFDDLNTTA